MPIEEALKNLIIRKYGSMRNFAPLTGLPYSTIQSILRRGVNNCNGQKLQAICDALGISATALHEGRIEDVPEDQLNENSLARIDVDTYFHRLEDLDLCVVLDGQVLEDDERDYLKTYSEVIVDILRSRRFRKARDSKKDIEEN